MMMMIQIHFHAMIYVLIPADNVSLNYIYNHLGVVQRRLNVSAFIALIACIQLHVNDVLRSADLIPDCHRSTCGW